MKAMSVIFKPRDGRGQKGIDCGRNLCYSSESFFFFLFFDKLVGQVNSSETTAYAGLEYITPIFCFKTVFTEDLIKRRN